MATLYGGLGPAITDHGGGLGLAMRRYGGAAQDWMDLSTGINPHAYPIPPIPTALWSALPDPVALQAVCASARRAYGATDDTPMAVASGSQGLIQILPRLFKPCRVGVVGFTYGEHARCWALAGHQVEQVAPEAVFTSPCDVVLLVNPNNPDGRVWAPDQLLRLAERLAGRGGCLVVDEAFVDLDPALSLAPWAGMDGLVVLRSFGKFYGLAGVRIGFAMGDAAVIAALEAAIGPWPLSGPAQAIACAALADPEWARAMRDRLRTERALLDRVLTGAGLTVIGGTDLFRLVACPDAVDRAHRLAGRHILVRWFAAAPHWLRLGLPGSAVALDRLASALAM